MKKIDFLIALMLCLMIHHTAVGQVYSPAPYCQPVIDPNGGQLYDRITNVHLGSINNSSNGSSAGTHYYTYYSNVATAALAADSTYVLSISVFKADAEMDVVTVYADYNQDSSFEASEIIFNNNTIADSMPNTGAIYTLKGNVTIPHTARGGMTRLRAIFTDTAGGGATPPFAISACFNNTTTPGTGDYGEIEDYNINVIPATVNSINTVSADGISIYPDPATGYLTVEGIRSGVLDATIYSLVGEAISMQHLDATQRTMTLSGLTQGIYILSLADAQGASYKRIFRVE